MLTFSNDNIKNWLKDSVNMYLKFKKDNSEEVAIVYSLLLSSKNKNSFLDALYDLTDINFPKIDINEEKSNSNNKFKYYKKISTHLEKLEKNFLKEFLHIDNGHLNLGYLEIVALLMIYYPEPTKKLFQLDDKKYHQLIEVLKQKILTEFKNNQLENVKKVKNNKNDVGELAEYGAYNLIAQDFSNNPLVGNEQALRKVIKVLLGGNSLIILGEAGVGKTTLVNGIAYNIKMGNIHDALKDKRIIMLPVMGLTADTQYIGTLEQHINDIISYARKNKDVIYFIDEIHMIMGAGQSKEDNIDISNLLKPFISDKTLQIIGATTLDEFDKTINCDPTIRRRFRTVTLAEPTDEEVINIANQYISIKSNDFQIDWTFNNDFLKILVYLTSSKNRKYYETINNPNITLNIIDGIFESALYHERDYINKQDVIEAIQDNEILSSTKKEELITKLSSNKFYLEQQEIPNSKILTLSPKNSL